MVQSNGVTVHSTQEFYMKKNKKLSLHMSSPEGKKQGGVPPIYYQQFAFHTPMYIP